MNFYSRVTGWFFFLWIVGLAAAMFVGSAIISEIPNVQPDSVISGR